MSSQPSVIPLAILSLCTRATRPKIKQRKERFQNDENNKVMGVTTTIQTTDPCLLLVPPPNIHHQQVSIIQKWHSVVAHNPSFHPSPLKQPQLLSKNSKLTVHTKSSTIRWHKTTTTTYQHTSRNANGKKLHQLDTRHLLTSSWPPRD